MAKLLFKVRQYGIEYFFAEIINVHTTISSEKNLAAKLQ